MPLFDFKCRGCGREFEALVRPGHTPACPSCRSADLEQQPSSFAVSSGERRNQSAAKARRKAQATAGREVAAREAEAEKHRHEDH